MRRGALWRLSGNLPDFLEGSVAQTRREPGPICTRAGRREGSDARVEGRLYRTRRVGRYTCTRSAKRPGPRVRVSGDATALRLGRAHLVGPSSICRGLYFRQRRTLANRQRVRLLLLLPLDRGGSGTGKDHALVLRHLPPALAGYSVP